MKSGTQESPSAAVWFNNLEKTLSDLQSGTQQNQTDFNSFKTSVETLHRRTTELEQRISALAATEAKLLQYLQSADQKTKRLLDTERELSSCKQHLAQTSAALDIIRKNRESIAENQILEDQLKQLDSKRLQTQDKLQIALLEKDGFRTRLANASQEQTARVLRIESDLKLADTQIGELQRNLKNMEAQLREQEQQNTQMTRSHHDRIVMIDKLKRSLASALDDLAIESKKTEAAETRIAEIEQSFKKEQDMKSALEIDRARLIDATARAKRLELMLVDQLEDLDNLRHINSMLKAKAESMGRA